MGIWNFEYTGGCARDTIGREFSKFHKKKYFQAASDVGGPIWSSFSWFRTRASADFWREPQLTGELTAKAAQLRHLKQFFWFVPPAMASKSPCRCRSVPLLPPLSSREELSCSSLDLLFSPRSLRKLCALLGGVNLLAFYRSSDAIGPRRTRLVIDFEGSTPLLFLFCFVIRQYLHHFMFLLFLFYGIDSGWLGAMRLASNQRCCWVATWCFSFLSFIFLSGPQKLFVILQIAKKLVALSWNNFVNVRWKKIFLEMICHEFTTRRALRELEQRGLTYAVSPPPYSGRSRYLHMQATKH